MVNATTSYENGISVQLFITFSIFPTLPRQKRVEYWFLGSCSWFNSRGHYWSFIQLVWKAQQTVVRLSVVQPPYSAISPIYVHVQWVTFEELTRVHHSFCLLNNFNSLLHLFICTSSFAVRELTKVLADYLCKISNDWLLTSDQWANLSFSRVICVWVTYVY